MSAPSSSSDDSSSPPLRAAHWMSPSSSRSFTSPKIERTLSPSSTPSVVKPATMSLYGTVCCSSLIATCSRARRPSGTDARVIRDPEEELQHRVRVLVTAERRELESRCAEPGDEKRRSTFTPGARVRLDRAHEHRVAPPAQHLAKT